MALTTRCPNCGTTFRVVSDQLKLRRGLVKCGSCATVFNGIEQLRYVATLGDGPNTVIRPVPPEPAAARQADAAPVADAQTEAPLPAKVETAPSSPPPVAAAAPPAGSEHPVAAPPDIAPAAANDIDTGASAGHEAAPVDPAATETPPAEAAPAAAPQIAAPAAPATTTTPAATDARPPLDRAWAVRAAVAFEQARAMPVGGPAEAGPLTLIEVERRPAAPVPRSIAENPDLVPSFMRHREQVSRGTRIALAVAAPLLALLLAGQALWLFHDEAAAALPAARPVLDAACARLGCRIALPRRADQLRVASAELRQTGDAGAYELRVGLRNDARWDQSWPSLDVSLTDLQARVIARRMLAPSDYLPAQPDAERLARTGLAARAEQLIVVPLRIDASGVSGYTIDAFFP